MKTQISSTRSPISFFKLPMLLLFVLSAMIFSCNTEDVDIIENEALQPSIVEVLESYGLESGSALAKSADSKTKKPTFKTLSVALAKTRLAGTVSSNMLTVFAPTDEAFAKYGLDQKNIGSFPGIVDILLYHAVSGKVFSTDLSNSFVLTLNGAALQVNLESGVMVNTSNVVIADLEARNGVIHAIDDILFPPTQDLVTLASSFDPEFSVLLAAATKAGLAGTLMNDGPFTVFAPTNQAFINFLGVADVDAAITAVNGLPAEALVPILLYHVVSGRVYSSDLSSGPVTTLNGNFELDLATLTIDGNAKLIPSLLNVQATNGVIHVINEVLVP